jgi:hypothetical protein
LIYRKQGGKTEKRRTKDGGKTEKYPFFFNFGLFFHLFELYCSCTQIPLNMGRFLNGINGSIVGTVGTVVGSTCNGVPYIKAKYKKRTKRVSKKELANREKFRLAQQWLQPLLDFVRVGYKGYSEKAGGFVVAKSWLLKNAVEMVNGRLRIEPSKMKVSAGDLPLSGGITASNAANGRIQFTWDPTNPANLDPYDQVMILAYCVETGEAFYKITGQFRSTGSDDLVTGGGKGKIYQLYLAFLAADRGRQSDSVYLGEIKF